MKPLLVAAILLSVPAPAIAHRLDEYLQETLLSLGKTRLQAELTLTPGVAVYPIVAADIDSNRDGVFSESEQRAYAGRVLRDLSLTIDGHPVTPRLVALRFPAVGEMKAGLGAIYIEFQADLPGGGPARQLVFENRHESRLGAYLVNCLVPQDPGIRIVSQNRNYSQSVYRLDYVQTGMRSAAPPWEWSDGRLLPAGVALLLLARFAFLWRRRRVAGCSTCVS